MISPSRLADAFVEIADTLVDDYDLVELLHQLTKHAAEVSEADAVGLLLTDQHDRLQFMASSNDDGRVLELFVLQASEGPCWDCFQQKAPVVNADLGGSDIRWPAFAPAAREMGFRSAHAFPMRLRSSVIGALGLFSWDEGNFDDDDSRVVQALADVATIAILQSRSASRSEALVHQLQVALTSRVLIEQAKGALSQSEGISLEEALARLQTEARRTGTSVTEVARITVQHVGPRD